MKAQGSGRRKREREKEKLVYCRELSLLKSSRSGSQPWHRAREGGDGHPAPDLGKPLLSLMARRACVLTASALGYFSQVSCENTEKKALFVFSQTSQPLEEPGGKSMRGKDVHRSQGEVGRRATRMFPQYSRVTHCKCD